MIDNNRSELGTKSVGKLLFSLAVPAITAQVVNMLYNIVDRMYIGHIAEVGATALTGVGICFPILMLISAFSALISMGGAPRAAIYMGKQDMKGAQRILGNCFACTLIVSLFLTMFFRSNSEKLLMLFGASAETLPYALSYINIYILGTMFVQLALGLNAFITTQGFAKYSMATVLIGAVINIILDPIFIFVFGMGVKGAALASVISQGASTVWVLIFLTGKRTALRLTVSDMRIRASVMLPVFALGISPFIMQSTESLINITLNRSLQSYGGDLAVGAMAILASTMQLLMMPLMGLSQGAQPIISYNFGAGSGDRVKKTFRLLLICSMVYSTSLWSIGVFSPQLFVRIFSNNSELVATACSAMRIYMGAAFMMGAQLACQQTFIAVGQAKVSLFLALLRKIILLLPLILILPNFFADKVFAVFLSEPIADFLATTTTLTLFMIQFPKILRRNNGEDAAL